MDNRLRTTEVELPPVKRSLMFGVVPMRWDAEGNEAPHHEVLVSGIDLLLDDDDDHYLHVTAAMARQIASNLMLMAKYADARQSVLPDGVHESFAANGVDMDAVDSGDYDSLDNVDGSE